MDLWSFLALPLPITVSTTSVNERWVMTNDRVWSCSMMANYNRLLILLRGEVGEAITQAWMGARSCSNTTQRADHRLPLYCPQHEAMTTILWMVVDHDLPLVATLPWDATTVPWCSGRCLRITNVEPLPRIELLVILSAAIIPKLFLRGIDLWEVFAIILKCHSAKNNI